MNKKDYKIWYDYYTKVHRLGNVINQQRNKRRHNTNMIEFELLEKRLEQLLKESSLHLDRCANRLPVPKWRYDNEDKTTWASNKKFEYGHLLHVA